jgi:hypothetical protein
MKLEEFDLEKALNGARVVTRDGREVTQLTKFVTRNPDWNLFAVVDGSVQDYDNNGNAWGTDERHLDLLIAVEPKRVWANVMKYANGDLFVGSECFPTLEAALNFARNSKGFKRNYVKTIQITDEV